MNRKLMRKTLDYQYKFLKELLNADKLASFKLDTSTSKKAIGKYNKRNIKNKI